MPKSVEYYRVAHVSPAGAVFLEKDNCTFTGTGGLWNYKSAVNVAKAYLKKSPSKRYGRNKLYIVMDGDPVPEPDGPGIIVTPSGVVNTVTPSFIVDKKDKKPSDDVKKDGKGPSVVFADFVTGEKFVVDGEKGLVKIGGPKIRAEEVIPGTDAFEEEDFIPDDFEEDNFSPISLEEKKEGDVLPPSGEEEPDGHGSLLSEPPVDAPAVSGGADTKDATDAPEGTRKKNYTIKIFSDRVFAPNVLPEYSHVEGVVNAFIEFHMKAERYKQTALEVISEDDKRIQDILHFIEFCDIDDITPETAFEVFKILKDARERRRNAKKIYSVADSVAECGFNKDLPVSAVSRIRDSRYSPKAMEKELGRFFDIYNASRG